MPLLSRRVFIKAVNEEMLKSKVDDLEAQSTADGFWDNAVSPLANPHPQLSARIPLEPEDGSCGAALLPASSRLAPSSKLATLVMGAEEFARQKPEAEPITRDRRKWPSRRCLAIESVTPTNP